MRVLITGSRGFIGAAAGAALHRQGLEVREMDLLGSGDTRGDIVSRADCLRFCEDVDVVVHGAAIHHAVQVRTNPDAVHRVNLGGTETLLSAAQSAGVRRFVYLSTAKIYGDPAQLPSVETQPADPLDAYARAKLEAEARCLAVHRTSGMELAILRPFSVYGVGQDLDTGYIGMLLAALRDGVSPVFPGSAEFQRDFVYIDDLIQLVCASVLEPLDSAITLNAASGRACTLAELVGHAGSLLGQRITHRYREPPAGTIVRTLGDINAAVNRFGYTPEVSIRDGLQRCIDWMLSSGVPMQAGGQSR